MKKTFLSFLALFLSCATLAQAQTYNVYNGCAVPPQTYTATYNATPATFNNLLANAIPGSVIYLASGNYGDIEVDYNNPSQFLTVAAAPGQTPVLTSFEMANASHVVVTGLTISSNPATAYFYIVNLKSWAPSDNIIFANNTVAGTLTPWPWAAEPASMINATTAAALPTQQYTPPSGINAQSHNCVAITGNKIFNVMNGIQVGNYTGSTGGQNYLLNNNTITDFAGDGIDNTGSNVVISGNVITNNHGLCNDATICNHNDGIQNWTVSPTVVGQNIVIDSNIVIQSTSSSMPVPGDMQGIDNFGPYAGVVWNNVQITNNVVITNIWNGIVWTGVNGLTIVNNTVLSNNPSLGNQNWIEAADGGDSNVLVANNITPILLNRSTAASPATNVTMTDNLILISNNTEGVSYAVTPQSIFVDPNPTDSTFNLHLLPNSSGFVNPAIGTGTTSGFPTHDITGATRSTPVNLGAYATIGSSVSTTPASCGATPSGSTVSQTISTTAGTTTPTVAQCPYGGTQATMTTVNQVYLCTNGTLTATGNPTSVTTATGNPVCTAAAACGSTPSGSTVTQTVSTTAGTTTPTVAQCPYGGTQATSTVVSQTYLCTNGTLTATGNPTSVTTATGNPVCTAAAACGSTPSGSTVTQTVSTTPGTTTPAAAQCPYGGTQATSTVVSQTYLCTNGNLTATGSPTTVTTTTGNPVCTAPAACGSTPSGSTMTKVVSTTAGTTTPTVSQCPYGGSQATSTVVSQAYLCTNGNLTATGSPTTVTTTTGNPVCTAPAACGSTPSGSTMTKVVSTTAGTTTPTVAQCPSGGAQATSTVVSQTYLCTNGNLAATGSPTSVTTNNGNPTCNATYTTTVTITANARQTGTPQLVLSADGVAVGTLSVTADAHLGKIGTYKLSFVTKQHPKLLSITLSGADYTSKYDVLGIYGVEVNKSSPKLTSATVTGNAKVSTDQDLLYTNGSALQFNISND